MRHFNFIFLFAGMLFVSASCAKSCSKGTSASGALMQTAVSVNGQVLTSGEFAKSLALRLKNFDAINAKDPQNVDRAKESVIREFVHRSIILAWAMQNKIETTESELDSEVTNFRKQYPDDLSFREALLSQHVSFEQWRERLRFSLLEKKLFEEIGKGLSQPTNQEIENFYKDNKGQFSRKAQIRLRQIVLKTQDEAERLLQKSRQ